MVISQYGGLKKFGVLNDLLTNDLLTHRLRYQPKNQDRIIRNGIQLQGY